MSSTGVLIGASVSAALSLYLFFKLLEVSRTSTTNAEGIVESGQKRQDIITTFFSLVAFSMFVLSLFLVSRAALDDSNYCYVNIANDTTSGSFTSYSYNRQCFTNTSSAADGFVTLTNWFMILCSIFLLIAMIWNLFLYVKSFFNNYEE